MQDDARSSFSGAKVMVFLGDDLLILRRDHTPGIPWPGCLDFPGGGREGDESPEACAIREAWEETGLTLSEDDLILAHIRDEGGRVGWYFAAQLPADRARDVRFGGEGAGWQIMSPAAFLAAQDAIPHFRDILAGYLDDRQASDAKRA